MMMGKRKDIQVQYITKVQLPIEELISITVYAKYARFKSIKIAISRGRNLFYIKSINF